MQTPTLKILSWRAEDTRAPNTGCLTDCHLTPSQRRTWMIQMPKATFQMVVWWPCRPNVDSVDLFISECKAVGIQLSTLPYICPGSWKSVLSVIRPFGVAVALRAYGRLTPRGPRSSLIFQWYRPRVWDHWWLVGEMESVVPRYAYNRFLTKLLWFRKHLDQGGRWVIARVGPAEK